MKPLNSRRVLSTSVIGNFQIDFYQIPHGVSGEVEVLIKQVKGNSEGSMVRAESSWAATLKWVRDEHGITFENSTGNQTFGYDVRRSESDENQTNYELIARGRQGHWKNLSPHSGSTDVLGAQAARKKGYKIKSQMPGKIVKILVQLGSQVVKDQPLVVMEAMKMENEIRSPANGQIKKIAVTELQAVETGTELIFIE